MTQDPFRQSPASHWLGKFICCFYRHSLSFKFCVSDSVSYFLVRWLWYWNRSGIRRKVYPSSSVDDSSQKKAMSIYFYLLYLKKKEGTTWLKMPASVALVITSISLSRCLHGATSIRRLFYETGVLIFFCRPRSLPLKSPGHPLRPPAPPPYVPSLTVHLLSPFFLPSFPILYHWLVRPPVNSGNETPTHTRQSVEIKTGRWRWRKNDWWCGAFWSAFLLSLK